MVEQPLKLESSSGRKKDRDCISSLSKAESVSIEFDDFIQILVVYIYYREAGFCREITIAMS